MFIITVYTYISIIYQKKRREKLKNKWNGMLIVGDDEHNGSRSCGVCWSTMGDGDQTVMGVGTVAGSCPAHPRTFMLMWALYTLTLVKYKQHLGKEIMLVLGFYGIDYYNSGWGTGSPTIIILGLWEDQVIISALFGDEIIKHDKIFMWQMWHVTQ